MVSVKFTLAAILVSVGLVLGAPQSYGPPSDGGNNVDQSGGLNDDGALAAHNQARADVGVPPLNWNTNLVNDAQGYAYTLASNGCQLQHSSSDQRPNEGENLYGIYGTTDVSMADATNAFVSERATTQPGEYNHWTQVVWRDTTDVGCAKASGDNCAVVVCRYSPPGNWIGQNPF